MKVLNYGINNVRYVTTTLFLHRDINCKKTLRWRLFKSRYSRKNSSLKNRRHLQTNHCHNCFSNITYRILKEPCGLAELPEVTTSHPTTFLFQTNVFTNHFIKTHNLKPKLLYQSISIISPNVTASQANIQSKWTVLGALLPNRLSA